MGLDGLLSGLADLFDARKRAEAAREKAELNRKLKAAKDALERASLRQEAGE